MSLKSKLDKIEKQVQSEQKHHVIFVHYGNKEEYEQKVKAFEAEHGEDAPLIVIMDYSKPI